MKNMALRTLIGSIAASALLGIYVLLIGNFGELEERVLMTALAISALSIQSMACGAAYEKKRLGLLPLVGVLMAMVCFLLLMIAIWSDSTWEPLWKSAGSLALLSGAIALSCLLFLPALAAKFRWAQWLGFCSALFLASILVFLIWEHVESDGLWRLNGVLAILVAAVTIGVPVLNRMGGPLVEDEPSGQDPGIRFCVSCAASVSQDEETFACLKCGVQFEARLVN